MTLKEACHREIIELHQFFEDWFKGTLAQTEANFDRFAHVMGEGFVIISPDGRVTEREPLLTGLWQSHGIWQEKGDGRIWIQNIHLRQQTQNLALATYEEWQAVSGEQTARLSSVLFARQPDLPNGVAWLHVHETWLPPQP